MTSSIGMKSRVPTVERRRKYNAFWFGKEEGPADGGTKCADHFDDRCIVSQLPSCLPTPGSGGGQRNHYKLTWAMRT